MIFIQRGVNEQIALNALRELIYIVLPRCVLEEFGVQLQQVSSKQGEGEFQRFYHG